MHQPFQCNSTTKFSGHEAGQLCQTDLSILTCGRRLHDKMKRKQDKAYKVAKTVRMDMRRLTSPFITLKKVLGAKQCHHTDASSMLVRSHFSALKEVIEEAIVRCANNMDSGGLKAGLKITYFSLKENDKSGQGNH